MFVRWQCVYAIGREEDKERERKRRADRQLPHPPLKLQFTKLPTISREGYSQSSHCMVFLMKLASKGRDFSQKTFKSHLKLSTKCEEIIVLTSCRDAEVSMQTS